MKIKDIKYELNTGESGTASEITRTIDGRLLAVIIKADTQVEIRIDFDGAENICLLDNNSIYGDCYLPLRTEAITDKSEKFNFGLSEWFLNNKLRIIVKGTRNTNTEIIFRIEE